MTNAAMVTLVKTWAGTSYEGLRKDGKLDKRRFNKQVLNQAWVMGIVDKDGNFRSGASHYPSLWNADLLWEILKDEIASNTGIALASSKVWQNLGLWQYGHKWHQQSMFQEMESILLALDLAGYIYFNCAGSVWSISIR